MAGLNFSALVSSISGKTGGAVFSIWKGRPYVRQRVIPANPRTPPQTEVRDAFAETLALWQRLTPTIQMAYDPGARPRQISGSNDFTSRNLAPIKAQTGLVGPRRNTRAAKPYIQISPTFNFWTEPAPGKMQWQFFDALQGPAYTVGGICYDATDKIPIQQFVTDQPSATALITFTGATIGHLYLVCAWIYRTWDGEFVHFGSDSHTQLT